MQTIISQAENQTTDRAGDGLDTVRSLAPKLKRSPRTVQAWTKAGKLPHFKIGKSVLYRWSDVLERLKQFRVN